MTRIRFLGGFDNEKSVAYYFNTKEGAERERERLRKGFYDKSEPDYFRGHKMEVERLADGTYVLRVYDAQKKVRV